MVRQARGAMLAAEKRRDSDHEEPESVAHSTRRCDSAGRGRMPAFRSVVSAVMRFVGRSFSTNSRPALRPGDATTVTGQRAHPSHPVPLA